MTEREHDTTVVDTACVSFQVQGLGPDADTLSRQNIEIGGNSMLDAADAILEYVEQDIFDGGSQLAANPKDVSRILHGVRVLVALGAGTVRAAYFHAEEPHIAEMARQARAAGEKACG